MPAFVPSSGFGYPPDGLLPSGPSEGFSPHRAPGITLLEATLTARYRHITMSVNPLTVSLALDTVVTHSTDTQAAVSGL